MECLASGGGDLGDDVVKLVIPYSDFYYLDLIFCHGGRSGGPRVGDEASRTRRGSGGDVCGGKCLVQIGQSRHERNRLTSILDIRRDEEVLFKRSTPISADASQETARQVRTNLVPYKSLTLLDGQDGTECVCRATVTLAMAPLGYFRLRINCTLLSFDVLFELSRVLLVVGGGRWGVGVAIGFIDLHVLDVGVVVRVRRSHYAGGVVEGVVMGVVVLSILGAGVVFRAAVRVVFIVLVVLVVVGDLLVAGPGRGRGSTTDSAASEVGGVGRVWGGYGCWVAHLRVQIFRRGRCARWSCTRRGESGHDSP